MDAHFLLAALFPVSHHQLSFIRHLTRKRQPLLLQHLHHLAAVCQQDVQEPEPDQRLEIAHLVCRFGHLAEVHFLLLHNLWFYQNRCRVFDRRGYMHDLTQSCWFHAFESWRLDHRWTRTRSLCSWQRLCNVHRLKFQYVERRRKGRILNHSLS